VTIAAWLFGAGGVVLLGIGAFFIFVRPSLLPEDLRFLGRSGGEIDEFVPQLRKWLRRVFMVLGGYAFTVGGLTIIPGWQTGHRLLGRAGVRNYNGYLV
jgi:hypothetical protein